MAEFEIGIGKAGRHAYGLDDVAIVPSRRTRDPRDVDISWEIDAYKFDFPILSQPSDSIVSPSTAVALGRLGACGVLHLEGLWTRYEDPEPLLEEIAHLDDADAVLRMKEIYAEPVKGTLITERLREIKSAGVVTAAAISPQRVNEFAKNIADAEPDLLVIRGTVVSAEHLSKTTEPLNLKRFIREFDIPTIVGGCASFHAALHLMRTGAVGVLVGVGAGPSSTTRTVLGVGSAQATAIADARGARIRHLDETGVYVHLIADGGMKTGGDIAKAIVCGADAVMLGSPLAAASEAPGRGYDWHISLVHPTLPRGARIVSPTRGTLEEVLKGPAKDNDGSLNLSGALRASMAMSGYETLKAFQKAELTVSVQTGRNG